MLVRSMMVLLIALIAPLVFAQSAYDVGDEIDDHHVEQWINTPAWENFSDLKGQVVVFKKWGCT